MRISGLTEMLVVNLLLMRRAFAPASATNGTHGNVDPFNPGKRIPVHNDDIEVAELTDTDAFNQVLGRLESVRRDSARRLLAGQEPERRRWLSS